MASRTKTEASGPDSVRPPKPGRAALKRFGQHFLEPVWVDRVVQAIHPTAGDLFIEIGAGRGELTLALARTGARVVAVEIDRTLAAALGARAPAGVEVLAADVLHLDVGRLVAERLRPGETLRVAGNIPYNISTPILLRLLDLVAGGVPVRDAHLMFQREVALRISAAPGSRHYGPLAVLTRLYADAERVLTLPPGAFRPAPRVYSAVVRLQFHPPAVTLKSPDLFRRVVRGLFTHRRKTVANALKLLDPARAAAVNHVLDRAGIAGHRRPETLDLDELVRLTDALAAETGGPSG